MVQDRDGRDREKINKTKPQSSCSANLKSNLSSLELLFKGRGLRKDINKRREVGVIGGSILEGAYIKRFEVGSEILHF